MKKIYQAPVTEEIKIAFKQQILEGSDPYAEINPEADPITDPSVITSREGSSFFDDNDEDY